MGATFNFCGGRRSTERAVATTTKIEPVSVEDAGSAGNAAGNLAERLVDEIHHVLLVTASSPLAACGQDERLAIHLANPVPNYLAFIFKSLGTQMVIFTTYRARYF
ncbi:MAG: hypothetical protein QM803_06585 [Rhodocyclaceae bacterium]